MRENIRDYDRLLHIKESILNIFEFVQDKSYDDLLNDKQMYFAVVKNIEIIGEASNLLTKEYRDLHNQIPWQDIIDMRHVLVHGYYTTSPKFIWDTCTIDLPGLLTTIEQLIKDFPPLD